MKYEIKGGSFPVVICNLENGETMTHKIQQVYSEYFKPETYKSKLFQGLKEAVLEAGDQIVFHDTFVLYLAKKPL